MNNTIVLTNQTNSIQLSMTPASILTGGIGQNNVYNEIPTGLINGTNRIFTISRNFVSNTTRVFQNGIRLSLGNDYTETSANQITFVFAPLSGDSIFLDYSY